MGLFGKLARIGLPMHPMPCKAFWYPRAQPGANFSTFSPNRHKEYRAMSSYALRLPESLKQAAKRIAAADDTTMNQFFVVAIAEKISAMETAKFFEQRAAAGNAGAAQAAWDKVGSNAAIANDKWSQ
jgi:hypothetical protein